MKNRFFLLALLALTPLSLVAQDVQSLRGANTIESNATTPDNKKWKNDDNVVQRQFVQQPPLIPHTIEGYEITLNANKCLSCHNWEKATEMKATKVSLTHFKDRDGVEHSTISASRYFCTQCHAPQKDVRPLIDNEYQRADQLKQPATAE